MRDLNDILRDVIMKLEGLGEAKSWGWHSKSPRGLYRSKPGTMCHGAIWWEPDLHVDTGTLVDAAFEAGYVVTARPDSAWASSELNRVTQPVLYEGYGRTTREGVVVALAKALRVETEDAKELETSSSGKDATNNHRRTLT